MPCCRPRRPPPARPRPCPSPAGALTNLPLAVCGGGPGVNVLYWPWFCTQTASGWGMTARLLLTGLLPPVLSAVWDTYAMPMVLYLLVAAERQ